MQCPRCGSKNFMIPSGKAASGAKRYQCKDCKKYFNENTGMGINNKQDYRDKQETRTYEENGNDARVTQVTNHQIKTLDEMIKVCEIDTSIWIVDRWLCNKWEVGMRIGSDGVRVQPLWQLKVWLKRDVEKVNLENIKTRIITEIKKHSQTVPKLKIKEYKKPCLLVVDIPDLHLDKLGWGKETGKDWDIKISSAAFLITINDLISKSSVYDVERILFVVGNDLFNADNPENTTTHGTKQIVDGRWKKTFPIARKLMIRAIDMLALIAPVDVMIVTGNHDEQRTFYLGDALECWYHNNVNVKVDNSPKKRKYYDYGNTLIGYTHGKDEKVDRLPMILATEAKDKFAKTDHHEWHLGDKHHKKDIKFTPTEEVDGVIIRFLSSLTALDEWHYSKGYLAKQAGQGFIYDKKNGWVCQFNSFLN